MIPGRWQLQCTVDSERVRVGPVIGIMSSRYLGRAGHPVSGPVGRFRRIITEARAMGALAFVFAPSGIQWRERTIRGYTYLRTTSGGRWVRGIFPFPNVVYNRIPTRKAESRPTVAAARKRLAAESELHLFNPQFLNKWEVYQALQQSAEATKYLPETAPLEHVDGFLSFLEKHRRVYLKQSHGSLGKGTACVELKEKELVVWRSTSGKTRVRTRHIRGHAAIDREITRLKQRRRRYLMQAAIPLLRTGNRPFDIRALVQKDPQEKWSVTGMAARIAGPGQITTHRPRGGSRGKLRPILRSVFRNEEKAEQVYNGLRQAIESSATAFDDATGRGHGELSLDVGLDQEGRPWILEINSKPMVFDEPSIRREARQRLIRYCFHRSGFIPKKS